jgi:S1-C subfamily serine protease
VASVLEGSPAEKAGIRAGDVLLAIGGKPVRALFFEEIPLLHQRIAELVPGRTEPFVVERDGEKLTIEVPVALMEESLGRQTAVAGWGVSVREITGPMALSRRWPSTDGVLVTGIRAGEPAAEAKPPLPRGAVILEVAGKPITDTKSYLELVAETAGKQDVLVRFRVGSQDVLTALDVRDKPEPPRGRELPKAWIGVRTQVLTTDVARALGMEKTRGFRITEVFPGTKAAEAGLRAGDIVTAVDGDRLRASRLQDAQMWRRKIENLTIGTDAELSVIRDGEEATIVVLLEETPTSSVHADTYKDRELEFAVREITYMDRIAQRWDPESRGVVVTSVTPGGWANLAGLRGGDLIQKIEGRDIVDLESFEKILAEVKGRQPATITVFVRRGFRTAFVFIEADWDGND